MMPTKALPYSHAKADADRIGRDTIFTQRLKALIQHPTPTGPDTKCPIYSQLLFLLICALDPHNLYERLFCSFYEDRTIHSSSD